MKCWLLATVQCSTEQIDDKVKLAMSRFYETNNMMLDNCWNSMPNNYPVKVQWSSNRHTRKKPTNSKNKQNEWRVCVFESGKFLDKVVWENSRCHKREHFDHQRIKNFDKMLMNHFVRKNMIDLGCIYISEFSKPVILPMPQYLSVGLNRPRGETTQNLTPKLSLFSYC